MCFCYHGRRPVLEMHVLEARRAPRGVPIFGVEHPHEFVIEGGRDSDDITDQNIYRFWSTSGQYVGYVRSPHRQGAPAIAPLSDLLSAGSSYLYTDRAGWEVHITLECRPITGATRSTTNISELSTLYHTLDWIRIQPRSRSIRA